MPPRLPVLAVAALLVSCSSGGTPIAPPSTPPIAHTTTTTSAIATPTRTGPLTTGLGVSPGEQPPRLPLLTDHTANGAYSVGAFFLPALDWSTRTTDSYLLREVSDQSCAACTRSIARLDDLQRQGSRLAGGRIRQKSFRAVTGDFTIKAQYVYEATVDEEAVVVVNDLGSRSTTAPVVHDDHSLIFVSWVNGSWRVVGWGAPS